MSIDDPDLPWPLERHTLSLVEAGSRFIVSDRNLYRVVMGWESRDGSEVD